SVAHRSSACAPLAATVRTSRMTKASLWAAIAAAVSIPLSAGAADSPPRAAINTEFGFGRFQALCFNCHGNPAFERAPSPAQLRAMSPEAIYTSLTSGPMRAVVGEQLTDEERRGIAESIAGRLIGTDTVSDASAMPNRCARNPALSVSASTAAWNGWSPKFDNARFQAARRSQLSAAQVARLKLKWAFGCRGGRTSAYAQPSGVDGRILVGTDIGYVYSIDAATGCVYWSYRTKAGVRAAISVGAVAGHSPSKVAAFVGDLKANVYALDARTGKLLWETKVDDNFTARVTAAPSLHEGTLYVPVSSWEEFNARTLDYPCCTSVGSVVALNASAGKQL